MGRIISDSGGALSIRTTSDHIFTVNYPLNAVDNFNTTEVGNDNLSIGTGDEIYVAYNEAGTSGSATIQTAQMFQPSLIIKDHPKTDSTIQKY